METLLPLVVIGTRQWAAKVGKSRLGIRKGVGLRESVPSITTANIRSLVHKPVGLCTFVARHAASCPSLLQNGLPLSLLVPMPTRHLWAYAIYWWYAPLRFVRYFLSFLNPSYQDEEGYLPDTNVRIGPLSWTPAAL